MLVSAFHKYRSSTKTKSFGTFSLLFLNCMALWHYPSKFSKTIIKNGVSKNFNRQPTPSQKVDDRLKKRGECKDGFALSFKSKYLRQAAYHLNVEATCFEIE